MLRFMCLRSSSMEATFWCRILNGTVDTMERQHEPFSAWVLPITGLCPGQWSCISHGPTPFFRSSSPSSKTSNSRAYWGWLWESGAGFRHIWSRGQAWVLLFCSRPQAEAASLSQFESHKDDVASSSLCPWRPYCAQEEEAWQVHESSKMRFLVVILLFHLQ